MTIEIICDPNLNRKMLPDMRTESATIHLPSGGCMCKHAHQIQSMSAKASHQIAACTNVTIVECESKNVRNSITDCKLSLAIICNQKCSFHHVQVKLV